MEFFYRGQYTLLYGWENKKKNYTLHQQKGGGGEDVQQFFFFNSELDSSAVKFS